MKNPFNVVQTTDPQGNGTIEAVCFEKSGICLAFSHCGHNLMIFPHNTPYMLIIYGGEAPSVAKMMLVASDKLEELTDIVEEEQHSEWDDSDNNEASALLETLKGQQTQTYALTYDAESEDLTLQDLEDLDEVVIHNDDLIDLAGAILMLYRSMRTKLSSPNGP